MNGLSGYLREKQGAVRARRARAASSEDPSIDLAATVHVEGRSGIRRLRIRDFQLLSDSLPDYAGFDLGPSSPELLLGVLGSCVAHTFLIRAAERNVALDSLQVEVTARGDLRAGFEEFPDVPVAMQGVSYVATVKSDATPTQLAELHEAVRRTCPVLNLLLAGAAVEGAIALA